MKKGYEIIWTDGYFIKVKIFNKDGVKQLEEDGYFFVGFYGGGIERWSR